MNTLQVARQLKFLLEERQWLGTGDKVFGTVRVSQGPDQQAAAEFITPFAIVRLGSGISDAEEPDLITQTFSIRLAVAVDGDTSGEGALIGRNRKSATSSDGRGLLEIEVELFNAIEELNGIDGVEIHFRLTSEPDPAIDEAGMYFIRRDYQGEAVLTADLFYDAPQELAGTPGAGSASLTWVNPATRFDSRRVMLRRKTGSSPPSSETDGTEVTLSGNFVTSHVDSPLASGDHSYAVFMVYDEFGTGTDEQFSASDTVTVTVT